MVVDDGSTDASADVIQRYPVTYIRFELNRGRCAARNVGKDNCIGGYVKFLDSDDTLEPLSLRKEYEMAMKHDADIVIAGWIVTQYSTDGQETIKRTYQPPIIDDHVDCILAGKGVPTSSALYRRSYIEEIKWEDVGPLDDWDFFIHATLKCGKIVSLPESVYQWRQHAGERVSGRSMLVTAQSFYRILDRLHDELRSSDRLSEARRKRLAQYYYKELRVLFRFHPPTGKAVEWKIFSLDAAFVPRDEGHSSLIRGLGVVIPLHWLMVGYGIVRRGMDRIGNA